MFGIGFAELLLILLLVFIMIPQDIPKIMRKIGRFFDEIEKLKNEVIQIKDEVKNKQKAKKPKTKSRSKTKP